VAPRGDWCAVGGSCSGEASGAVKPDAFNASADKYRLGHITKQGLRVCTTAGSYT